MFQTTDTDADPAAAAPDKTAARTDSPGFSAAALTPAIVDTLFSIYGTLDPRGKVLALGGKVFERTFADPQMLVGQNLTETVFWQTSEENFRAIGAAVEGAAKGMTSKTVLEFRISKEEKCVLELNLCPVYTPDGRALDHIFLAGTDVTPREKEIEFHKKRAEHLLYAAESAEIGLWFWDLVEDRIFSTPKCNEFFEKLPFETIAYPDFLELIHPDDAPKLVEIFRESQKNGTEYDVEYRVLHSDGALQWLSTRGTTYLDADGRPANMMGVVRRITDRKQADQEISRVYALEKKARDEAEEANRTKDYFLALVSHELRSPLNAVLGWTKILLTKEVDEKTRRSALETIERSALSQAKLISDLVDSSRIASGKLRLEMRPMNIFEAVNTIFNSQKPVAESKKIDLRFDYRTSEATVFGDLHRLQQVFTNLLTNALKFTPEGGRVALTLETDETHARIAVEDNGQGIAPETLPHIFRQFSQGEQTTSNEQGGLGLGLSIVKTLVEKHEGKVTAQSAGRGRGARFDVTLPLLKLHRPAVEDQARAAPTNADAALANLKILCVEDDQDSREVLQLFLEQNGARVRSVDSAARAVESLDGAAAGFDVIISDLAMPGEDGYSLISRIRRFPAERGGRLPAIALSAFTSKENKDKALAAGFQRYHTKPFEPDLLIEDILKLVGSRR